MQFTITGKDTDAIFLLHKRLFDRIQNCEKWAAIYDIHGGNWTESARKNRARLQQAQRIKFATMPQFDQWAKMATEGDTE